MSPDAALGLCRFLHDASAMLLWGASAYLWTLVPRNLATDIGWRLRSFTILAIVVAEATTVTMLPLEAAIIGEGWSDAIDPSTIGAVLFETTVGRAWLIQAAAAAILTATLAIPRRSRQPAIALASGLLLATVASTGHAVMQAGWEGIAHRLNDTIHVLSAGAWLGALLPLLPILAVLKNPENRFEAGVALKRFSTVGHVVVALALVSGVVNTALVLGRWPTDWSSPYQAMLAFKIALVAAMVGFAAFNRYVLVPGIAQRGSTAVQGIVRGTIAEIAIGIAVVGLVSVFGMLEPT